MSWLEQLRLRLCACVGRRALADTSAQVGWKIRLDVVVVPSWAWSTGKTASVHQGSAARYAVPFFYEPRFDAAVAPAMDGGSGDAATSSVVEPVCFGSYLMAKLGRFYQYDRKQ
ncbi:hypothetical protein SYNPS1DRAFT_30830 [Syncephalis pseudoplumigaleata]|uniref:Uncharacterized protein n=1 Tax=Syncephalis pseudoplumigaleata TaxID=1712513 RepID=A0A4P9YUG1_9FUNG|nr:hypothetical protein SYNPS1DRAFT_30830 [Syncephalis pseudoplumigaleata]|eukprot:RKP23425.1 hypothetical protein SYNPS1DRAFT_30830 [Syncephalis pseudoplumigaleata]